MAVGSTPFHPVKVVRVQILDCNAIIQSRPALTE